MMPLNDFIVFAYESGICLAVLFTMYWLFLKRETYFRFNRFYLLSIILVAFTLPLLNLGLFENSKELATIRSISKLSEAISIPAVTITNGSESLSPSSHNWQGIGLIIYLLGASLLLARVILGIFRIEILKRKGRRIVHDGYSIIYTQEAISPFSFFRTIYLSGALTEDPDCNYIIKHEAIHIKQLHSYDKLFVELFLAIFWFNPFMWFLKGALRDTHEYLADNGVIKQKANPGKYQTLLLKQTIGFAPIALTSTFNSTIRNRIIMMCKNKSSVFAKFKPLLLIPIIATLFLIFTCTDKTKAQAIEVENAVEPSIVFAEPDDVPQDTARKLFYVVEDMPKFNDVEPEQEFRIFIAQNLQYPESAARDSISGRVIVQFCINSEGKLVEPKVIRSASPALDKEAIRVVSSSPLWTPGKQEGKEVDVLFYFPINFVLQ